MGFFQAVQSVLAKRAAIETTPQEELDNAVRQIISRAVVPEGVIDIFAAAGFKKPDISILSDEFLAEVRGMEHRNLAVELLQRAAQGRGCCSSPPQRGSGPVVRGDAGCRHSALPESVGCRSPSDRGTNRTGP